MACERIEIEKTRQKTERKACAVVAEELGVSIETVRTWMKRNNGMGSNEPKKIIEAPSETCAVSDLQTLIDSGKKFGTILADPPWKYSNQATRSATNNHYKTLSVEEISLLPIVELTSENAHLHLWTTNAFLFDSKAIIEAWGFEYKSCFVWVKPQMGIGNYWRVSHEFLLLGVKGNLPFADHAQMSWGNYERTKHSSKPERIRKIIEKVSSGPYLELFGRRTAENWVVWGNEIERDLFNEDAFKNG